MRQRLVHRSISEVDSQVIDVIGLAELVHLSLINYLYLTNCIDLLTRPPIRSRPSRIVTFKPLWDKTSAHLSPAKPAPTMQT